MPRYVDGFVIPIKRKNISSYKKLATLGCKVWTEYGALDYYECIGDDLKNDWGLTFPKMCKLKKDETAIFAFIVYKSKAHRNKVNAQVMKDPRMHMEGTKMPFSMTRFAMGGFKVLVQAK
jgi:uncharacterized protein YbaA (DUF1428 family)